MPRWPSCSPLPHPHTRKWNASSEAVKRYSWWEGAHRGAFFHQCQQSEQGGYFMFPWWGRGADGITEGLFTSVATHYPLSQRNGISCHHMPKVLISSCPFIIFFFLNVLVCANYTPQHLHASPWIFQNSKGSRNDSKLLSMFSKECKSGNSTLKAWAGKSILPIAKHFTFNIFEPAYETISLAKTTFPH